MVDRYCVHKSSRVRCIRALDIRLIDRRRWECDANDADWDSAR